MNLELRIMEEHVGIEDITGKSFGNYAPGKGEDIVGRRDGKAYVYGWPLREDLYDWNGYGVLGVNVDRQAFLERRELLFLRGVGEWVEEEK